MLYNQMAERLWEKLEAYRDELITPPDIAEGLFPDIAMVAANPIISTLCEEVNQEFQSELEEKQVTWALYMYLGPYTMEYYNNKHGLQLCPRK